LGVSGLPPFGARIFGLLDHAQVGFIPFGGVDAVGLDDHLLDFLRSHLARLPVAVMHLAALIDPAVDGGRLR
jgi:hypothetical protein